MESNPQETKKSGETDMQFVDRLLGLIKKGGLSEIAYLAAAKTILANGEKSLKDRAAREKLRKELAGRI